MGLTAIISSSASSSSASAGSAAATSLVSSVGLGVGGIFVAVALVLLLAYLDVFNAADWGDERVSKMLVATILPLGVTFGSIVLYQSLQVI